MTAGYAFFYIPTRIRMDKIMNPSVVFEELNASDLASALGSLTGRNSGRNFVFQPPIGLGHERFLRWSLADIEEAEKFGSGDNCERAAVNAVMNARRALSNLADQYLQRDGIRHCRRPPNEADEKAKVLTRRRIFDGLASKVLAKAINLRNEAEHRYESIGLLAAQEMVHIVRSTIQNATALSSPYESPALFGHVGRSVGTSPAGIKASFLGWHGSAFVSVSCVPEPWAGIIIPSNDTDAVVRKVALNKLSVDQWLEALDIVESLFPGPACSGWGIEMEKSSLRAVGLVQ